MPFFVTSTVADVEPAAANELIRQVREALANLTAAQMYVMTDLEPAERRSANEWLWRAKTDAGGALIQLYRHTGIRCTASGSWVETWPVGTRRLWQRAENRRRWLEARGHAVRGERHGGNQMLVYVADAPEPLLTEADRARGRAVAEVTR